MEVTMSGPMQDIKSGSRTCVAELRHVAGLATSVTLIRITHSIEISEDHTRKRQFVDADGFFHPPKSVKVGQGPAPVPTTMQNTNDSLDGEPASVEFSSRKKTQDSTPPINDNIMGPAVDPGSGMPVQK